MSLSRPLLPSCLSSLASLRAALERLAARWRLARLHARSRSELQGMSDHELMDLGLGRSESPEWLRRSEATARSGIDGASKKAVFATPRHCTA